MDVLGGSGNDTITGTGGADSIDGGAGQDVLLGLGGDDVLKGSAGLIDSFNEPVGNDTLFGGTGNDTLYGGGGNDVYHFEIGDGRDTIDDRYQYRVQRPAGEIESPNEGFGGYDTLQFGVGITRDNLWISLEGDDLLIGIRDGPTDILQLSDLIRWENQIDLNRALETISFWTAAPWIYPELSRTPAVLAAMI